MGDVKDNFNRILKTIEPYNPTIVAVTKYYDETKMIEAYNAGLRNFGESKAIEAVEKINKLDDVVKSNSTYHFIGHLQTNKVKHVVKNFSLIQSVDSLKLAKEIDKTAKDKGVVQRVLIQVNNADEESKFGVALSNLNSLVEQVTELSSIKVEGFMNIAPNTDDRLELEKLFCQMRKITDEYNFETLSMGMSNDYKIALECGATMIRLGRILFS